MMNPKSVLIAGGETPQRRALANALEASGAFRISDVASAQKAIVRAELRTQRFDAIIVDAALPDASGSELPNSPPRAADSHHRAEQPAGCERRRFLLRQAYPQALDRLVE
jgi:PleD family two-component response regulator